MQLHKSIHQREAEPCTRGPARATTCRERVEDTGFNLLSNAEPGIGDANSNFLARSRCRENDRAFAWCVAEGVRQEIEQNLSQPPLVRNNEADPLVPVATERDAQPLGVLSQGFGHAR